MKKKIVSIFLAATLAVSMIAGCGQKNDTKKETKVTAEKKEKKEKKVEYKTIGTKAEGAYEVQLTNATGQDITAVTLKSSSEENYPDTMLAEGDSFKNEEIRNLYYKPSEEAAQSTETEDGKELPAEYTMKITLADNTELELHAFPFEDMKKGEIKVQDGLAYLTYTKDDSEVSTLEAEKAVKEQKEAEAAAKAQAEAEAAAKAQAEADAAAKAQAEAEQAQKQKAAQSSQTQQRSTTSNQSSGSAATTNRSGAGTTSGNGAANSGASNNAASSGGASNSGAAAGGGSNEGCVEDGLTY